MISYSSVFFVEVYCLVF